MKPIRVRPGKTVSRAPNTHDSMSRRRFIGNIAKAASVSLAMPLILPSRIWGGESPDAKLNIACIGLGGQMQGLMRETSSLGHNIVALCDVDNARVVASKQGQGAAGLVALRIGHEIKWDEPAMKSPGLTETEAFVKAQCRVF